MNKKQKFSKKIENEEKIFQRKDNKKCDLRGISDTMVDNLLELFDKMSENECSNSDHLSKIPVDRDIFGLRSN